MTCQNTSESRPLRSLTVELPIALPTWNQLLGMNRWKRKKVRDLIHHAVFISIASGNDWPMQTVYQGKQRSTDSFITEYYQTIRPSKLSESAILKRSANEKTIIKINAIGRGESEE